MSEEKIGVCNINYNIRLYTDYIEYFKLTNQKFNSLVLEYYTTLIIHQELLTESARDCRAKLEKMLAEEEEKEYIPSRFRRSAMMQAIGQAKAYMSKAEKSNKVGIAKEFHIPATFYQEMYKYLENRKIKFKLYNGKTWEWYESKFSKWNIPEGAVLLSPSIKINKQMVMACIPVKITFRNLKTIRERMEEEDVKVCGVAFSGRNNIATCAVVNREEKFVKSLFVKGGDEYKYLTSQAMRKIKGNNHKAKNLQKVKGNNKKYWNKLTKYRTHYAHVISKKIVDFCIENEVRSNCNIERSK